MNKIFWFLAFSLLGSGLFSQNGWRPGEMEIKVSLLSEADVMTLKSLHLMDEPALGESKMAYVYVTPDELKILEGSGLYFTIINPDLHASSPVFSDPATLESYHTYAQMVELADSLATAFPAICKKILLGTSVEGRELGILKISDNVNINEPEAEIMYDGGIHGNEIMGPEIVIRYARELCIGYGTNPTYTDIINNREIWLYYLVNPDGYVSGSRYNSNGIDCNRDMGFMWNGEGNSPSAYSQIETKTLRDCLFSHNFTVYTNFHGGIEIISYPWSYRSSSPPDLVHINNLASVYSSTSGYPNLGYGQGCNIMYQIFGSTKDCQYGILGQVGWSIEVTMQKQPPASQIPMYYNYNIPAMTEVIKRCGWGAEGIITDSITGSPVKAAVFIGSYYPVFTDPEVGDFHKYLLPGTYDLTIKASGYETKTIQGVQVPPEGSIVVNVQLAPAPGRFAYKAIGTQIPSFPSSGTYADDCYLPGIIGAPDSVTYSLGKAGYLVIDMGDTIFNANGNDFKVYEGDITSEGYFCYVSQSMDGPWTYIGPGNGTTGFDLAAGSITKARYIKLTDDGDGSAIIDNAGFDLDAIEILTPPLIVDFTASNNTPCIGNAVNFTDETTGDPTSWLWTFPGGTPATSTVQNPTNIVYDSAGFFDVTLVTSNTYTSVTKTKTAFIHVYGLPEAPTTPTGPEVVCRNTICQYITTGSTSATSFIWNLTPPEAGTVTGAWVTATVTWDPEFTGTAFLKVKEVNACGEGAYSDSISILVHEAPTVFLGSDTTICAWESINLDAGNPGCEYLWSSGQTTQTILVDSTSLGLGTHAIWVEVTNNLTCSESDTILLTFDACTSIPEQSDNYTIRLYPNPSTGNFSLQVTGLKGSNFTLISTTGQMLFSGKIDQDTYIKQVDMTGQASGIYYLKIADQYQVIVTKIIHQ